MFSNISKILSRSEEEQEDASLSLQESHHSTYSQVFFKDTIYNYISIYVIKFILQQRPIALGTLRFVHKIFVYRTKSRRFRFFPCLLFTFKYFHLFNYITILLMVSKCNVLSNVISLGLWSYI